MKQELDKCVLVIDEAMPRGLAANTAAILGITWGRLRPELVGEDVTDAAGAIHPGIIRTPVPVLSGRPETFQTLRRQLAELEFADVAAVDFTDSGPELPYLRRVHRKNGPHRAGGAAIPGHGPFGPPASGGPADRKPAAAAVGKKRKNGAAPGCGPILVSFPGGLMAPAGSTDPPQHHRHWCTNSCRQSRSLPRWHTTYYRIGSMRR